MNFIEAVRSGKLFKEKNKFTCYIQVADFTDDEDNICLIRDDYKDGEFYVSIPRWIIESDDWEIKE